MKYFKMVSGKGKVEMSENEVSAMMRHAEETLSSEPTQIEVLEERVNKLSQVIDEISQNEVFKGLLSLLERQVEKDGTS